MKGRTRQRGKSPACMRELVFFATLLLLIAGIGTATAVADESTEPLYGVKPSLEDSLKAMEEGPKIAPETDSPAAEQLPHQNLDRAEAVELLTSVFGSQIEGANPFTDLEVQKFLSDNVALVDPGTLSEGAAEEESSGQGPVLLESSIPFRVENSQGEPAPLDLSLETTEGELKPEAPLVEVGVPDELGEGISLPETGVTISLEGAPLDKSSSTISDETAVYPNVAEDTDFAVTPSPTGVETFTQLRSGDSPRKETFNLDLPTGAVLEKTKEGGAEVVRGKETLLVVPPASAIDATGKSVPVDLDTSGSSLTVQVSPSELATFPILVDPLFESFKWAAGGTGWAFPAFAGWISATNEGGVANYYDWNARVGLFIADSAPTAPGDQTNWNYYVPRFTSDYEKYGVRPTTYINGVTLENVEYRLPGVNPSRANSPYFQGGIWNTVSGGWIVSATRTGVEGQLLNVTLPPFLNLTHAVNAKNFGVALISSETLPEVPQGSERQLYVGTTTLELADNEAPEMGSYGNPSGWVNKTPTAQIPFSASDRGLGMYKITVTQPGGKVVDTSRECTGGAGKPCPREWSSTVGQPQIAYDPSTMATGEDWVKIAALDPVGHSSAETEANQAEVRIKVDHTPPSLALSGTLTEQASFGTSRPSYEVTISSSDGTTEKPQSGAAKTAIEVDGKVVNESTPGCTTQNCSISRNLTLNASEYASGSHVLKAIATDAVGNTATASQSFKLQPAAPPSVELAGTATQQATLGTSRPRYTLKVNATTSAGFNGMPMAAPTYASSAGSPGTGKGQLEGAEGSVVDSKGNLWVAAYANGHIEEFNTKGEYLGQFGEPGIGTEQLYLPTGLALDAAGNFWITTSDNRIKEFSPAGKFIKQFGQEGSADGYLKNPVDIAFDAKGNLWVLEHGNRRVQEFSPEGKFLTKFGSRGSANGQFEEPWGITITPDGSIWVADTWNYRLQRFNSEGKFLGKYGEYGAGNGNLSAPWGIRADSAGNLYVSDGGNGRVEVFNSAGEYLTQFGSAGKGPGQFSWPSYLAIDPGGNIWVDDSDSEVQRWHVQAAPPTFSQAFGSKGTGAGQFTTPSGVTTDSAGNLWVVDRPNARIEKFNAKGEFQSQFGTKGNGAGQLLSPYGVAIDPSGNVWVTDTGNTRVAEFNAKGEFVATFGTNVNKTKVEAGGTQAEKNLCTAASKNVCQAGNQGSLEGQMKEPTGIAIAPGGNLFVVEKNNGRVEKFSPTGAVLANFGTYGAKEGQLQSPTSVAVAPDGSLWVADTGNRRIEEWTSTFGFVRAVGKEGSGNGQFTEPWGLTVDSSGNVWVADMSQNRIQGFSSSGDFLAKFGIGGSGEGQFSSPYGLVADSAGSLWIADTGHSQIQKWIPPTSRASTITSEISVDGTPVSTKVGRCGVESCSIAPEWVLEAGAYPGKHTTQVKATDGLGRSTTKTLVVEMLKDTVKPTLEVKGSLFAAPQGWVEQQGYGLEVKATDAGYGLTSLVARIDGQAVASWSNACTEGGCTATISKSIDMSAYAGGAHSAEIVAIDGAGNTSTKLWTINVDPEGHVSAQEAAATLKAVDTTGPINTVGPSEEEEEYPGTAPGLGITEEGGSLVATGTEAPTTINPAPGGSFTVAVPEAWEYESCLAETETIEESEAESTIPKSDPTAPCAPIPAVSDPKRHAPIEVMPVSTPGEATATTPVGGNGVVSGNTSPSVDTVVRPLYDGAMTFADIRDQSAPEQYSWKVKLEPDQEIRVIDSQHAQVYFDNGHPAFGITAVPAHDAVGTSVPTTLSVSGGNIITLTVQFKSGNWVYPIIAGAGWQGGIVSYEVEMPPVEPMPGEEVEEWEEVGVSFIPGTKVGRVLLSAQGPPVARPGTNGLIHSHRYKFSECRFRPDEVEEVPQPERRILMVEIEGNCMREAGDQVLLAGMSLRGWYWYKSKQEVWVNNSEEECHKWGPLQPAMVHCEAVPRRDPHHVVLYGNYKFPCCSTVNLGYDSPECVTLWAVLTTEAPHKHEREPFQESINKGDACNWPQR